MNKIALFLKIALLIITTLIFIFSLISGAEEVGGGLEGIIKNSPNALPWAILYFFLFITWKWELAGGIILILFSLFSFFFFKAYEPNLFILLVVVLPLLISGIFFIVSNLRKDKIDKT